ncbi:MAG: FixJ family two-component response regulator [Gammaproteobacteria bacterium]
MPEADLVYVVDGDDAIVEGLTTLLNTYNIRVKAFPDAENFLHAETLRDTAGACLITALELPGMSGLSLLRKLRARNASLPIIVLTNTVDRNLNHQALALGATDVIDKPLINAFLMERLVKLIPNRGKFQGADVSSVKLRNVKTVTFRAMCPEDADIEQAFVRGLSNASKHSRFFSAMKQLSPKMLEQFTHPSFPSNYALIATTTDNGHEQQIGVARYLPTGSDGVAEFAVVVADEWQELGIASRLLHGIISTAAIAGIQKLEGIILRDNPRMLKLARELGFITSPNQDDPATICATKDLRCQFESYESLDAEISSSKYT